MDLTSQPFRPIKSLHRLQINAQKPAYAESLQQYLLAILLEVILIFQYFQIYPCTPIMNFVVDKLKQRL